MADVQFSRQELVRTLRKARFYEAADEAMRVLPDPVDLARVLEWGQRHGITRDVLVSDLGGSP